MFCRDIFFTHVVQSVANGLKRFLLGAFLIATSSCFLSTEHLSPERLIPEFPYSVPESWQGGEEVEPEPIARGGLDFWWLSFEDEGLNEVIERALAANHDLKAAAARLQQAEIEAVIAGAELYPQLGLGFNASRSKQVFNLPGLGEQQSFLANSFGVSLDASWEIDLWGRIRSSTAAAIADFQAEKSRYRGAAISLAAQTAKAWFALSEARLQLELAVRTAENFAETARQAANRVDAGVQVPSDKYLTAANLASAEALSQQRRETYRRSVRQLEILLGYYPSGELAGAGELPAIPATPESGIPAQLLSRRPDLIAAERQLAASLERVDAAEAALYPQLNLTASTGTASNMVEDLLDGDFLIWTIAGNLVQPVFQGGRLRAQVDLAEGREKEALENFAQSALNAFSEVEIALSVDELLAGRQAAQQRASENAHQAEEIAENRYEQGVDTLLTVLEAQRRALDASSAVIAAHRLRLENRINLVLALGGGFGGEVRPVVAGSADLSIDPFRPAVFPSTELRAGGLDLNAPPRTQPEGQRPEGIDGRLVNSPPDNPKRPLPTPSKKQTQAP